MLFRFFLLFVFTAFFANANIKLLSHQKKVINYMQENPNIKGVLVSHQMGTGKTFLAIGFAESYPNNKILVLAPRFVEGHWLQQMKQFGLKDKDIDRYEFVSYHEAYRKLKDRDLSDMILVIDEAHNLPKLLASSELTKSREYSEVYEKLKSSKRILALTGTPIYTSEDDLAVLLNLVSNQSLLPYNKEEFRLKYTEVLPVRSFWRGYFTESMIVRNLISVNAALAIVGPISVFLVPPVMAVGMIGFPIFNNLLYPIEKHPLRRLDGSKLEKITQEYVSYYEINNLSKAGFPTQKRHKMSVDYSAEQFQIFLDFAAMDLKDDPLIWMLQENNFNLDNKYIKLNSTALQKRLRVISGVGRDIGNYGTKKIPKFDQVFDKFKVNKNNKLEKTVIYSNYFENGILEFVKYLDKKGYANKYQILGNNLSPQNQAKLVDNFNSGKKEILLLHPDVTEGISLKGARQFHILEPVLNSTTLEQIIARAVRYQSHAALQENQRHVDVYLWKSVIGTFNFKNFELRKKDWLARYRELSDWSDFGIGLIQVDKNYEFKLYSPDEKAALDLNKLDHNINIFKKVLRNFSIESKNKNKKYNKTNKLKSLEQSLPFPTTNLTVGYFFSPNISWLGQGDKKSMPKFKSDVSFRIGLEVPLYKYLYLGAHSSFAKYSFPKAEGSDGLYMLGASMDLKTKIPVYFGTQQYIAPYLSGSLGVASSINSRAISDFSKVSLMRDGKKISKSIDSFSLGFAFPMEIAVGLEYYPIALLGFFVQGALSGTTGFHRVQETIDGSEKMTWNLDKYFLDAWQIQFGLKLGF